VTVKVNWVTTAAQVLEEGIKALVPGSGPAVDVVSRLLAPQMNRLEQRWRDKAEQEAFARSVAAWAREKGYGEADIDRGGAAARDILRQNGASWERIVELNLDATAISKDVLANDPVPQQGLGAEARDVCDYTIHEFYERLLIESGLRQLNGAVLRELLLRAGNAEKGLRELNEKFEALLSAGEHETRRERYRRLLGEVRDKIIDLEGAEAEFRSVVRPGAEIPDTASIRDARMRLVMARVGLEARSKEIIDPGVRTRVLGYVTGDENEDSALRSGLSDTETFDAVRAETIRAYRDAQDAVAEALREEEP
jgi:hypothetical protein